MRRIAVLALSLAIGLAAGLTLPAGAETIVAFSQVTAVTLYPQGAQVTREVTFAAAPGPHDLLIADLPAALAPETIRLDAHDVTLGAFTLRSDPLPPDQAPTDSPSIAKAKVALDKAKLALAEARRNLGEHSAEAEADRAQITFLTGLKPDTGAATADSLAAIADMIQGKVRTASADAKGAEVQLPADKDQVAKAQEALDKAQTDLDALLQSTGDYVSLSVAVTTTAAVSHLILTHMVPDAAWTPVYDVALDRKAGRLTLDRGILVSQSSGEDWAGVTLTLSTARPSDQSAPSQLSPDLKQITDPQQPRGLAAQDMQEALPAPMVAAPPVTAALAYQGDTVIYNYPSAVDLANGTESLRLALDRLTFTPKIVAEAVPRLDATAFLLATLTNDSKEVLLPGTAYLTRDGALVGMTDLALLAPGAKVDLGFGAIEGLKLTRDMPERAQGDRGIFTTSTQLEEKAVLKVENLTDEAWPVHLIDRVPYSEQEALKITFTADPPPSVQDVEGQRGILAWDFDLAPKTSQRIRLDSVLSWPQGKVLQ